MNILYRRSKEIVPTADVSLRYWNSEALSIFAKMPEIDLIEVVRSGNKTDSNYAPRGVKYPPPKTYVIVASTGGKWGKSRRDYSPR